MKLLYSGSSQNSVLLYTSAIVNQLRTLKYAHDLLSGPKDHIDYCHHIVSVVVVILWYHHYLTSFLRNHRAKLKETLQESFYGQPCQNLWFQWQYKIQHIWLPETIMKFDCLNFKALVLENYTVVWNIIWCERSMVSLLHIVWFLYQFR